MSPVLYVLFVVDLATTLFGVYAFRSRLLSRKLAALSAGMVFGVALFWILPDMTERFGIAHTLAGVAAAFVTLCAIDRFVYPFCPCCARSQQWDAAPDSPRTSYGGDTLIPLVLAICIHNLFDGWTATIAGHAGERPGSGIALGLIAHKIPEAVIFGVMLRSATNRPRFATMNATLTSVAILAGGALQAGLWHVSETLVMALSLALACGAFLFIGIHTFAG